MCVTMTDIPTHQTRQSFNLIQQREPISGEETVPYGPIAALHSYRPVSEVASPAGFHSLVSLSESSSDGGAAAVLPLTEQPDEP